MTDAARRVLARAARQPFDAEGAMVVAAAAVLAGEAPATADPGVALVAAAALADAPLDRVAELGRRVPMERRPAALSVAEPFLARIDPAAGWRIVDDLIGAETAKQAAIGLQLNAPPPYPEPFARQLAADAAAREATERDDRRLAALRNPTASAAEASALLVAAAEIDAAWVLDAADRQLEGHPPAALAAALRLLAGVAVRAGLGAEVVKRATTEGFVSEQATWAAAASSAGALSGHAVADLAAELAPRVTDELDPGRELIAGLPLIEALAYAGQVETLIPLALDWRLPPPLLASRLFFGEAREAAAALADRVDELFALPPDAWDTLYRWEFGWWVAASGAESDQRATVRDVLAIAGALPWQPLPGSLADITRR